MAHWRDSGIGNMTDEPDKGAEVPRSPDLSQGLPSTSPAVGDWDDYAKMMAEHHAAPGWTFCRFGIRGPLEVQQSFGTGIACAPFGASWARFLCVNPDIGYNERRSLVALTHTPSGYAVGVFNDMALAVEAAELVMRMSIDWTGFGHRETVEASVPTIQRVRTAWNAAGIWFSPFIAYPMIEEAVPLGMPSTGVFIKNVHFTEVKPEGPLS